MPTRRTVLGSLGALAGAAAVGGAVPSLASAASAGVPGPVEEATRRWLWDRCLDQVDFVRSKQVSSGGILGPTDDRITPYFVSWAAMGLAAVNTAPARDCLGRFIEWYLAHLNTAEQDTYGFPGTVFVYLYDHETGEETSTDEYSSVDAGVTCPLIMARDAYATGDPDLQALVLDNISSWELMATAVVEYEPDGVRAEDDLCWSRPRPDNMAYVQDNAVVFLGLQNLAWLERKLGRDTEADFYRQQALSTKSRILSKLWNTDNQNWSWGHGTNDEKPSDPAEAFMPDAWCQYWQTGLRVVTPDSREGIQSWQAYNAAVPRWMHNEIDNDFPHTEMALTAAMMGDTDDALTLLRTLVDLHAPDYAHPWYVGEAGHFMRTAMFMINSNGGRQ